MNTSFGILSKGSLWGIPRIGCFYLCLKGAEAIVLTDKKKEEKVECTRLDAWKPGRANFLHGIAKLIHGKAFCNHLGSVLNEEITVWEVEERNEGCNGLLRTSAETHELKIKSFSSHFVPFIFTFLQKSMIPSAHHGKNWLCITHNNNKDRGHAKHAPWETWYKVGQSQHSFGRAISKVA